MLEIIFIILTFIARSLTSKLGLRKTNFDGNAHQRAKYDLPNIRVSMPFQLRDGDVVKYQKAIRASNIPWEEFSSVQACLFLSAITEPAMLLLLAHNDSPILPLGAVNVRNKLALMIQDHSNIKYMKEMDDARVEASFVSPARQVKRGVEIDLQVQVLDLSHGQSQPTFRQIFTMLQFMKIELSPASNSIRSMDNIPLMGGTTRMLSVSSAEPLSWAEICKDYNPIHVSNVAARLFGFGGIIAHGNHLLALAMELIEEDSPKHEQYNSVEVQFKRPCQLPAELNLRTSVTSPGYGQEKWLHIDRKGKTLVEARLSKD